MTAIAKTIPHAVDLILGVDENVKSTHNIVQSESRFYHDCSHGNASANALDDVAGRCRNSPYPMISIEDALNIIKETIEELPKVQVDIWQCLGRVLSETVYSPCHIPPFRASIKDGYAVICSDGKGKRKVLGGIEAGRTVKKLNFHNCKFL